MARKTAGSSSPSDDADVTERKRQRSPSSLKGRPTQPRAVRNARARKQAAGGLPIGPDLEAVDWLDLFQSEDNSPSATASEFRRDDSPRSVKTPSLFVDARELGTNLVYPAPAMTRVPPRRWPPKRYHLTTWLATASRRQAMELIATLRIWRARILQSVSRQLTRWQSPALTRRTHYWLSDRSAWVLGSVACLVLIVPSATGRFRSPADTIAHSSFAIAAPTEVWRPRTVLPSSPLESAPFSLGLLGSPLSSGQTSATDKSSDKAAGPAGIRAIVGTLVVTSEPAGAAVFMNQRYVGLTPLETSVKAGSYAVVVELDGARWTDVVLVRGERVTRVERQLQLPSAVR